MWDVFEMQLMSSRKKIKSVTQVKTKKSLLLLFTVKELLIYACVRTLYRLRKVQYK